MKAQSKAVKVMKVTKETKPVKNPTQEHTSHL